MARKLSEILIEIAMQGLKHEKYSHSNVMHALVFLAHVAWNRDAKAPDYLEEQYRQQLAKFPLSEGTIKKELITDDWDAILARMLDYRRKHHFEDRRIITLCGYTSRDTFRVEWQEPEEVAR
jgi:hypothetical protein